MHPIIPYALVMAVLLGALIACEWRRFRLGLWLFKVPAALTFVAAALGLGALASPYGQVMLVGFIFCVGGDILLIPRSKKAFLGGLVSFLLGHVGYAAAFLVRGVDWACVGGTAAGMAVVALLVGRWLLPKVEAPMKVPVLAYMTVISAMVALSAGTVAKVGDPLVFVGAFTFYLSDLCVARERFVGPSVVNRAIGLPLYFGAQLVLAATVLGAA